MNYNEFMKMVENNLATLSQAELAEFILSLARYTKHSKRAEFLSIMQNNSDKNSVVHDLKKIEQWVQRILKSEIYFDANYYSGDYPQNMSYEELGDLQDTCEYEDNFDLGKDLVNALQAAQDLMYKKDYSQSAKLYDQLCALSFPVWNKDSEDWEEIDLETVEDNNLAKVDLDQIAVNRMYLTYQTSTGMKRAADIYKLLFEVSGRIDDGTPLRKVILEDIFSTGPEALKNIELFQAEWIDFLKTNSEDFADELLIEACMNEGGLRSIRDHAPEVAAIHPSLYKFGCEQLLAENNPTDCESLGLEALRNIPHNLVIRGEIADITAIAAQQLNHTETVTTCYQAAFMSSSTIDHYLRLFELPDHQLLVTEASRYAQALPLRVDRMWSWRKDQKTENLLTVELKNAIRFFNGEFDTLVEECKKDTIQLGWSSQFKGIIIPLFILLFNQDNRITTSTEFLLMNLARRLEFNEKSTKDFTESFSRWKETMVITDTLFLKYIDWLKEVVAMRAEAIVGGGYRKSYYKAAELISALGETMESRETINGRNELILQYIKKYSRKRAFKGEFKIIDEDAKGAENDDEK